jgi:hypothetical protein
MMLFRQRPLALNVSPPFVLMRLQARTAEAFGTLPRSLNHLLNI